MRIFSKNFLEFYAVVLIEPFVNGRAKLVIMDTMVTMSQGMMIVSRVFVTLLPSYKLLVGFKEVGELYIEFERGGLACLQGSFHFYRCEVKI